MNRLGYIGGTDAQRIMAGDWINLYLEKTGAKQPEDLSGNFQVALGKYTEIFHIDWVMKKLGYQWRAKNDLIVSKTIPYMAGHLDGWIEDIDTFIEVKHTNEWMSAADKARYYMPQLQHYLFITEKDFCYFSVIRGNHDPEYVTIKADPDYQHDLVERITVRVPCGVAVIPRERPETGGRCAAAEEARVIAAATDAAREQNGNL